MPKSGSFNPYASVLLIFHSGISPRSLNNTVSCTHARSDRGIFSDVFVLPKVFQLYTIVANRWPSIEKNFANNETPVSGWQFSSLKNRREFLVGKVPCFQVIYFSGRFQYSSRSMGIGSLDRRNSFGEWYTCFSSVG